MVTEPAVLSTLVLTENDARLCLAALDCLETRGVESGRAVVDLADRIKAAMPAPAAAPLTPTAGH
jgi:hypothetical protein